MMATHEMYMQRCLELAAKGCGHVAPNPMVGAVLVCEGKIIGEGYHRKYGGLHAEPTAIASVKNRDLLRRSTLYVNLEPCSHYGKTPPCAQLIIDCNIPHVVIGNTDPYPEVSGRGIKMLRQAGIEVTEGVLEEKCEQLNKRFFTFHRYRRPYIILKWAQSADGYMDGFREYGDGKTAEKLSSETTRRMVHKLRAEEAAIMVGTRTALLDNPSLTVRHWFGKQPLRIFIDKNNRAPRTHKLFDDAAPTLVYRSESLLEIVRDLYQRKIQSLIVEGGAKLIDSFLSLELWDEIQIETVDRFLHTGVKAPLPQEIPQQVYACEKAVISSYTNRKLPKIL